MQRKTRRIIGAVALIGALAAGGAAFTAGNPLPDQTQSNSSAHITGATASNLSFQYSSDGSHVIRATITLAGDESATGTDNPYTIKAGFTGGASTDELGSVCGSSGGSVTYSAPNTTVVCDFTTEGPAVSDSGYDTGTGYITMKTTQFNLLVTGHA